MWTLTVRRSLIFVALFTEMNKRNRASTVGHDWLWYKAGLILTISFLSMLQGYVSSTVHFKEYTTRVKPLSLIPLL